MQLADEKTVNRMDEILAKLKKGIQGILVASVAVILALGISMNSAQAGSLINCNDGQSDTIEINGEGYIVCTYTGEGESSILNNKNMHLLIIDPYSAGEITSAETTLSATVLGQKVPREGEKITICSAKNAF